MKHWEIIADNLSKAGFSWGCVSTINSSGQTIFVADAQLVIHMFCVGLPFTLVVRRYANGKS